MNSNPKYKMKWVIYPVAAVIICVSVYVLWCCCFQPVTTVFLVRHAEKISTPSSNPPLSPEGKSRAESLAHVLGSVDIKAIYASEYLRTQQTVEPLAVLLGLEIIEVPAGNAEGLIGRIKANNRGEAVIVAGHSNTIPEIIGELGGNPIEAIPENVYDNLYVIRIFRCRKPEIIHLKYGNPNK